MHIQQNLTKSFHGIKQIYQTFLVFYLNYINSTFLYKKKTVLTVQQART